jgi:hypothetical protein
MASVKQLHYFIIEGLLCSIVLLQRAGCKNAASILILNILLKSILPNIISVNGRVLQVFKTAGTLRVPSILIVYALEREIVEER